MDEGLAAILRRLLARDEAGFLQPLERDHGRRLAHSLPLAEFALRDPVLAPQLAQEAPLPCRYVVLQRAALQQSRKGPENDAGEIADAVFRVGVIFRRMPERLVLLCQKDRKSTRLNSSH